MAIDRTFVSMILSPQFWRMSLLWTAALVASHLRLLFLSSRRFPRRRPALLRPLCIVTGATSGLGAATAMELASEGFHVLLVCMLLFSYELHRQLYLGDPSSTVSVTSADPGAVETNIMREIPSCLSQLAFTVLRILGLLQSPVKGAGAVIDAALAPPDASGEYFFGGKGRTIRSSTLSYNAMLATKLWSSSFMLLRGSTTQ